MPQSIAQPEDELRERLRFETFLADLALRFQRLPADQLDDAIGQSLRGLVETPRRGSHQRQPTLGGWSVVHDHARLRAAGDSAAGVRRRVRNRPALVHGAGASWSKGHPPAPPRAPSRRGACRVLLRRQLRHEVAHHPAPPGRPRYRRQPGDRHLPPPPRVPARLPRAPGTGGQRPRQRDLQDADGGQAARGTGPQPRGPRVDLECHRSAGPGRARHCRERGLGGSGRPRRESRRPRLEGRGLPRGLPITGGGRAEAGRAPGRCRGRAVRPVYTPADDPSLPLRGW